MKRLPVFFYLLSFIDLFLEQNQTTRMLVFLNIHFGMLTKLPNYAHHEPTSCVFLFPFLHWPFSCPILQSMHSALCPSVLFQFYSDDFTDFLCMVFLFAFPSGDKYYIQTYDGELRSDSSTGLMFPPAPHVLLGEYKYSFAWMSVSDQLSARVQVKACAEAHIVLARYYAVPDIDSYEIRIGKSIPQWHKYCFAGKYCLTLAFMPWYLKCNVWISNKLHNCKIGSSFH